VIFKELCLLKIFEEYFVLLSILNYSFAQFFILNLSIRLIQNL
jgi:hypothetical protein